MFSYQKSFVNPTLPVDEQQFYALVSATQWNDNIDKYRETGEASLKRKLPAFIFQAMFDETLSKNGKVGRWRKQAATRLTGLVSGRHLILEHWAYCSFISHPLAMD